MSAEVETMFYLRKEPWHGLGTQVMEAPNSKEALKLAGLDWKVVQEPLITGAGDMVDGYKANVRNTDNRVLGVVGDRYRIVQNEEAFAFTDDLLGYGVRYETAGSLQGGKKVWMLAHMPQEYIIVGEHISPYLLFSNSHDGSGAVKVAITPSVKRSVGIKKRRYFVHRFSGQTEQEQRTYQTGITVVSESWNTVEDIRFADITNRSTGRARMDIGYGK